MSVSASETALVAASALVSRKLAPALRARRAAATTIAVTRVALAISTVPARRANHAVEISDPAATTALAADAAPAATTVMEADAAHAVEAAIAAEAHAPASAPGDPEEDTDVAGDSVMAEDSDMYPESVSVLASVSVSGVTGFAATVDISLRNHEWSNHL